MDIDNAAMSRPNTYTQWEIRAIDSESEDEVNSDYGASEELQSCFKHSCRGNGSIHT